MITKYSEIWVKFQRNFGEEIFSVNIEYILKKGKSKNN